MREKLRHYYEVDIDNCIMTNEDWIDEILMALKDPEEYTKNFKEEYKNYLNEIQS